MLAKKDGFLGFDLQRIVALAKPCCSGLDAAVDSDQVPRRHCLLRRAVHWSVLD
jgi:hypothetical protein